MSDEKLEFDEALTGMPIKDLGLAIAGTALEPILVEFEAEIRRAGIHRFTPRFYLSNEWGVPMDTIAIAIPFYLARPDLARLHLLRTGHVEGLEPRRMLRYLRHEMGHVMNYAYRLYLRADWRELFGSFDAPYVDDYRPRPFDHRFVRHLPGWYAQKHPDEDWAETFAVWMTPGSSWRTDYRDRPAAMAKLEYCERAVREAASEPPLIATIELDEDVAEIGTTLRDFYGADEGEIRESAAELDGLLRDIFADLSPRPGEGASDAAALVRRLQGEISAEVFQWTGCAPERIHALMHRLAERARAERLAYGADRESAAVVGLTAMLTALAMTLVVDDTDEPGAAEG